MAVAGAEVGVYCDAALFGGQLHYVNVEIFGDTERISHFLDCRGQPVARWCDDVTDVVTAVNDFVVLTAERIRHKKVYRTQWQPFGARSVVSMSAISETRFIGRVSAFRVDGQPDFEPEVVRKLRRRIDTYLHSLTVAAELDYFDDSARATLLFSAAGEPKHACARGQAWLEHVDMCRDIRALIGEADAAAGRPLSRALHGSIVRITPVRGEVGHLYHVSITTGDVWQPSPVVRLPTRKRRIAQLAAFGATNDEIAAALQISTETVRSHLRTIFDRLNIGSRVELAVIFNAGGNEWKPG